MMITGRPSNWCWIEIGSGSHTVEHDVRTCECGKFLWLSHICTSNEWWSLCAVSLLNDSLTNFNIFWEWIVRFVLTVTIVKHALHIAPIKAFKIIAHFVRFCRSMCFLFADHSWVMHVGHILHSHQIDCQIAGIQRTETVHQLLQFKRELETFPVVQCENYQESIQPLWKLKIVVYFKRLCFTCKLGSRDPSSRISRRKLRPSKVISFLKRPPSGASSQFQFLVRK